jgi:aryl-alcohol dehydrogenase-like predicted oxidoreductase
MSELRTGSWFLSGAQVVNELRELGNTGIKITPVAMGCWPIAGMTSLDVNERDSLATLRAAFDAGINFFDTAYAYGIDGLSERLIAQALGDRRDEIVIATKCGIHWNSPQDRVLDARPEVIRREFEESLRRLATDRVELLYLHAHDGTTPIAEIAGAMAEFVRQGTARSIGVSNLTLAQTQEFHTVCPIAAIQPPYNMLMREIEADLLPWCRERSVAAIVYWPLMKGLLAGKLPRDFQFRPGDGRAKYPMFQGAEWEKNQNLLDELRRIAGPLGKTVGQLVVNWTIHQPGIAAALCGAKRPEQILESAGAMGWTMPPEAREEVERALVRRGRPVTQSAV